MTPSPMDLAIEQARQYNTLHCAVLAMGNETLVHALPSSDDSHDPAGHAVVNALRELGKLTHQLQFPGYTLYTTIEPCPMCAAACVLARLDAIFYGLSLQEIDEDTYPGSTTADEILNDADYPIELRGGIKADACRTLI